MDRWVRELNDLVHTIVERQLEKERAAPCCWEWDDHHDYYDTTCGTGCCLEEGTIVENDYRWCPFCGGKIIDGESKDG